MRTYKRARGSRAYLTGYVAEKMERALRDVRSGVSFWKAAADNGVPRSTLHINFRKEQQQQEFRSHGGQPWLDAAFETAVIQVLNELLDWKVPLTLMELRLLVKNYLDLAGFTHDRFKENMPGRDWARSFLRRHGLLLRFASRIKPDRAKLSKDELESYFANLRETLDGVDPSQIYNFDETNFTDDPTRKKCIVRPGVKRLERVTSYSKQAFSVMFCGSASGEYLPPMVVYKAKHMYEGWASDGIDGAVYGATKSGWFDMRTFEQWFNQIFLPHVKDVEGPKVLIGDNLSSHFSPAVVASCKKHNIRFVTLLPNSTHLCQPLDVAVFRPMKILWRAMLTQWRMESRSVGTIPKESFPRLLARVFVHLKGKNLEAGFRASGIVPLDSSQVLCRLTGVSQRRDMEHAEMVKVLNHSVLSLLQNHCGVGPIDSTPKKPRGNRVSNLVTPGKAIACIPGVADLEDTWTCHFCKATWEEDDDNRWIVCDRCDSAYHLQHSGVQYRKREYYSVDIQGMAFFCDECK